MKEIPSEKRVDQRWGGNLNEHRIANFMYQVNLSLFSFFLTSLPTDFDLLKCCVFNLYFITYVWKGRNLSMLAELHSWTFIRSCQTVFEMLQQVEFVMWRRFFRFANNLYSTCKFANHAKYAPSLNVHKLRPTVRAACWLGYNCLLLLSLKKHLPILINVPDNGLFMCFIN